MTTKAGVAILLTNVYTSVKDFAKKIQDKFLSASAVKRKTLALRKTMTAGILVFRKANKIATLYLQRETTSDENVLLGTASNNPIRVEARIISKKVFSNLLIIAPKTILEKHKFQMGPDIDKNEPLIKSLFHKDNGDPKDSHTYAAGKVPVGALLPYGSVVKTGTVTQATYTSLEQFDDTDYLADWTELVASHSPETQKLFLTENDLKKYLPAMPQGHHWADDPWVKLQSVDDDNKELEDEVTQLARECEHIIKANTARDDASAPFSEIDLVSPRQSSPEKSSNSITEEDRTKARAQAFGMRYNPEKDEVSPLELAEFFETVIKTTSKNTQREFTQSSIHSIEEEMGENTDFLMRSVDVPKMEKIVLANASTCKWDTNLLKSLDQTDSNGLMLNMLMADSVAAAKTKAEKGNLAEAEELLGEHHSKRSKLDEKFTPGGELHNVNGLIAMLANLLCLTYFWFKFNLEQVATLPSIVAYTSEVAIQLTSRDGRKWIKNNPQKKQKFLCYVVNQLVAVTTTLAKASNDVMVTSRILEEQWSSVPTKYYKIADKILKATLSEMAEIFLNSRDVPTTTLWNTSKSKLKAETAELNKMAAAVKDKLNDRKRESSHQGPDRDDPRGGLKRTKKELTGDKKGYIKWEGGITRFRLPKELHNDDFTLCRTHALDGVECQFGDTCKFSHMWLNEIDDRRARCLVKFVDADSRLSFVNVDDELLRKLRS